MKYYVVIPAHNEDQFIAKTLDSLLQQTVLPNKVVIVNDNSTDETASIVKKYVSENELFSLVNLASKATHLPGSKVVRAFNEGYNTLDDKYDCIVKLDADIVLPPNYFETLISYFVLDPKIGLAGGFAYIEKDGRWQLENLTNKDHIRGAFKMYRKECFLAIGKLKPSMGWDTVDELLAQYHGWTVKTDETLKVQHLKPTGASYNTAARYKQGEAFYKLGYGIWLTLIASFKLALLKKKPSLVVDYIQGFLQAKKNKVTPLVSAQEAQFVRKIRWKGVRKKIGL